MSYVQMAFQLAKFPLFIPTPKCGNNSIARNIEIGGAGDPSRLSWSHVPWSNLRNFFRQQYHFQGFGIVFKTFAHTQIERPMASQRPTIGPAGCGQQRRARHFLGWSPAKFGVGRQPFLRLVASQLLRRSSPSTNLRLDFGRPLNPSPVSSWVGARQFLGWSPASSWVGRPPILGRL